MAKKKKVSKAEKFELDIEKAVEKAIRGGVSPAEVIGGLENAKLIFANSVSLMGAMDNLIGVVVEEDEL